jgi:hypothetical protein
MSLKGIATICLIAAIYLSPSIIMAQYSFIQDMKIVSVTTDGKYTVVSGTMKVYFCDEAWEEFGYKSGNFYWFQKWWNDNEPFKYGVVEIDKVSWTLLEHTASYDELAFVAYIAGTL